MIKLKLLWSLTINIASKIISIQGVCIDGYKIIEPEVKP